MCLEDRPDDREPAGHATLQLGDTVRRDEAVYLPAELGDVGFQLLEGPAEAVVKVDDLDEGAITERLDLLFLLQRRLGILVVTSGAHD